MRTGTQILDAIRKQPFKYLREPSLEMLEAFLSGYFMRYSRTHSSELCHEYISYLNIPLVTFSEWIASKYNFGYSRSAFAILSLMHSSKNAFEKFFSEIEDFIRDEALLGTVPVKANSLLSKKLIDRTTDIQQLRTEGAMILGWTSVDLMRSYLDGDIQAITEIYGAVSIVPDLSKFENWINKVYETGSICRWEKLLLFLCDGDQTKAYFQFYKCLDNFVLEKRKKTGHA